MKLLARVGAILTFTFFFIPGVWLATQANGRTEAGVVMLGLIVIGIAFFAGPMLWLAGERCCPKQDNK